MARATACPTDIVGAEPGESSWQGSARKGVPSPWGQISGERQLESRHSLGSGDSQVESREQEAVRNVLGCKERTGKKGSGLFYILLAKADLCLSSLSLELRSSFRLLSSFQGVQANYGGTVCSSLRQKSSHALLTVMARPTEETPGKPKYNQTAKHMKAKMVAHS